MLKISLLLSVAGLSLTVQSAPAQAQAKPDAPTKVMLRATTAPGAQGVAGQINLSQSGTRLLVEGSVSGLKPSMEHGFHFHENGDCSGDGKAAGEHFNPQKHPHASPGQPMRHAGDLYNLKADAQGRATVRQEVDAITLAPGSTSVMGKALVVHAKPDDYKSQPAGDSGDRLACGVVGG